MPQNELQPKFGLTAGVAKSAVRAAELPGEFTGTARRLVDLQRPRPR
jgi:hypothetical protein